MVGRERPAPPRWPKLRAGFAAKRDLSSPFRLRLARALALPLEMFKDEGSIHIQKFVTIEYDEAKVG